ncbi:MAG TPA: hypothetical protein PLI94_08425 [Bacillota bacterium]|nr:hypothetical protein [Bacillota bacterium]HPT68049.1 hypothetical protein [Bacillota bacterium]
MAQARLRILSILVAAMVLTAGALLLHRQYSARYRRSSMPTTGSSTNGRRRR